MTDVRAPAEPTQAVSDDTVMLPPHARAAEAAEYAAQVHEELAATAADTVELNAAALLAKHLHQHQPGADWFRVSAHHGVPSQVLVARDLTPAERVARPVGETSPPFAANGLLDLDPARTDSAERRHLARVVVGMVARGEALHAAHHYGLIVGDERHAWVQVALALGHWETFTGPQ